MTPETIGYITKLINEDVDSRRNRMMDLINNCIDVNLETRIREYREARAVREEFEEHIEELEETE